MKNTILVTGASGTVGTRLALSLARAPELDVRALVRDPARAGNLAGRGVQLHRGSFEDAASLASAFAGVDVLALITAGGPRAAEQAGAATLAARTAGVRKIVRLSAIKASADGPTENTRQHAATERALRDSGLVHVLLRPQFFMQNTLASLPTVAGQGKLHAGVGDGRIGMIDARDVADSMERAVRTADFDGQTLELTGPRAVSHAELAAALAEAIGRPVEYVPIPPEVAGESLRAFGADDWTVRVVADYMRAYRDGFGDFVTDAVPSMTGRPARDIATFAAEVFAPAARTAT